MKKLNLADGTEIYFETSNIESAFGTQSVTQNATTALRNVTKVGGQLILESVQNIKDNLESIKPDELEIEIGLTIGVEGSVIVTKGTAEANIKIKAIWKS